MTPSDASELEDDLFRAMQELSKHGKEWLAEELRWICLGIRHHDDDFQA